MNPTQGIALRGGGGLAPALPFDSVSYLVNSWKVYARRDKSIGHAQVPKNLIFVQEKGYLVTKL